ncbi:GntR family transcriptional regulator [Amycolatopsis pithecellobii]|uniref:FCD domain-containing protein n=1 Tax=Amycolatopsis pithecellobii TaxID=664692 RepID=A0A6N7ZB28_9PSEU|nr:GntR family transcriptional regulator [Amycolatopsis pithecellobii]MTD58943.1 FCD domain-containing protein [Amycolatopsis pithecellobii]
MIDLAAPRRKDEVEAVHDELRRQILHNELESGARINQAVIARDLRVSRGPVREALRLLQREGLVEHVHQHQMRVACVSVSDLEQLYAMRIALEAFAVGITVPQLSGAEFTSLESALGEMDELAAAGDIDPWEAVHTRFHAQLTSHAGERICQELRDLSEYCARYRRLYITGEPLAWAQGAEDHAAIVDAVRSRDASLAASRLGAHLGKTALTVATMIDQDHEPATVRAAIRMVRAS